MQHIFVDKNNSCVTLHGTGTVETETGDCRALNLCLSCDICEQCLSCDSLAVVLENKPTNMATDLKMSAISLVISLKDICKVKLFDFHDKRSKGEVYFNVCYDYEEECCERQSDAEWDEAGCVGQPGEVDFESEMELDPEVEGPKLAAEVGPSDDQEVGAADELEGAEEGRSEIQQVRAADEPNRSVVDWSDEDEEECQKRCAVRCTPIDDATWDHWIAYVRRLGVYNRYNLEDRQFFENFLCRSCNNYSATVASITFGDGKLACQCCTWHDWETYNAKRARACGATTPAEK